MVFRPFPARPWSLYYGVASNLVIILPLVHLIVQVHVIVQIYNFQQQ